MRRLATSTAAARARIPSHRDLLAARWNRRNATKHVARETAVPAYTARASVRRPVRVRYERMSATMRNISIPSRSAIVNPCHMLPSLQAGLDRAREGAEEYRN